MKKIAILFAGLFLMTFAFQSVNAQNPTAAASADASATIISPISIVKVSGMDLMFGNIIADANGGTVKIATDGTPTLSGVAAPSITGERQQAQFTVGGLTGVTYAITLPASTEISNGTEQMTIDGYESDPSGTGTISTNNTQVLNVGATLNVAANQQAGKYTGTFSVTVAYN